MRALASFRMASRQRARWVQCPSVPDVGESALHNNLRRGFTPRVQKPARTSPTQPQAQQQQQAGNKLVLGADKFSLERWKEVDRQLNKYPSRRTFTAIGTGGAGFRAAMVQAVESVVGCSVGPEDVSERPSSQGAYLTVKIEVTVSTPEQVVDIFAKLKADSRLKWVL